MKDSISPARHAATAEIAWMQFLTIKEGFGSQGKRLGPNLLGRGQTAIRPPRRWGYSQGVGGGGCRWRTGRGEAWYPRGCTGLDRLGTSCLHSSCSASRHLCLVITNAAWKGVSLKTNWKSSVPKLQAERSLSPGPARESQPSRLPVKLVRAEHLSSGSPSQLWLEQ